jgi:hypothetical protein
MRTNSLGDLYPFLYATSGTEVLDTKQCGSFSFSSPRVKKICPHFDACQLGKHSRLPFSTAHSRAMSPFDLIQNDLWTSPTISFSSYQYYLMVLDDFSHFSWVFLLRDKSDTCARVQ